MGHGVVGSGVAEILLTHKQKLFASIGEEIYIKKVLDLRDLTPGVYTYTVMYGKYAQTGKLVIVK